KTRRGPAAGGGSLAPRTRIGRSVAYRPLGARQFSCVSGVETLPYGNGSGASALLNTLYPSGTTGSTRDYEKELYNNGAPSYEVTGSYGGGTSNTQYFVNMTTR